MHVLMLCALDVWALPGGAGAPSLYRTLRAYGERGHRVTFVGATIGANSFLPNGRMRDAGGAPPDLPGVRFELFHLPSLQQSRLPLPGPAARVDQKLRFALLFPALAARRAEAVLKRDPVDLLYGYEVHGALALRLLRRRHTLPAASRFQGTVMHPALRDLPLRLRRYEEVLALRAPVDLCIMTDDGTQGDDVLARLNPAALPKLRFWRNGLDLDRLAPATPELRAERRRALHLPEDAFVLLTASRLAAWKRVDRALSALPEVLEAEPKALLVIVGDGEERSVLEQQAHALGVAGRVRFAGAVPHERVVEYMQAADVFLAVAGLSNVGNPLLESLTCGLPAIAVDAGATRDLVRDGETGRLLPSGDPALIAAAAASLLRDAELRQRLASGARRYAEAHFWTWDARMRAELEEVERLVQGPVDAGTTAARSSG